LARGIGSDVAAEPIVTQPHRPPRGLSRVDRCRYSHPQAHAQHFPRWGAIKHLESAHLDRPRRRHWTEGATARRRP